MVNLMTKDQTTLCERIRRVGYAQGKQVSLYGHIFDLVSDPFVVGENIVMLDGVDRQSGQPRRLRIPLPIVQMAKDNSSRVARH